MGAAVSCSFSDTAEPPVSRGWSSDPWAFIGCYRCSVCFLSATTAVDGRCMLVMQHVDTRCIPPVSLLFMPPYCVFILRHGRPTTVPAGLPTPRSSLGAADVRVPFVCNNCTIDGRRVFVMQHVETRCTSPVSILFMPSYYAGNPYT